MGSLVGSTSGLDSRCGGRLIGRAGALAPADQGPLVGLITGQPGERGR